MSNSQVKIETIRHSLSHILASAVSQLYPDVKFGIGPAIENGFYYDFDFSEANSENSEVKRKLDTSIVRLSSDLHNTLSRVNPENKIRPEDLPKIELAMRKLIKQNLAFTKKEVSKKEALALFKDQPYKIELIRELSSPTPALPLERKREGVTIYQSGDFIDLCAGPHINSTKEINPKAFKLTKLAGAYWHGDEKNSMLTRIYGVAFDSEKELADYLHNLEEAEKRDHRKIGKDLDLFLIDPTVGMGLVLWQPKGAMLWRVMEDFWYREHLKNGYELVRTPHIGSRALWERSGHWGFFSENMYPPLEVGQTLKDAQEGKKAKIKEEYLLKPMNCPFHITLYNSRPHSYRELPLRWAECGTVYRYEKSGELSGLTRVRGFTQDDAHIICTKEQVRDELKRVAKFIVATLNTFGFKDFNVYLSLRDPKNETKYAGNDRGWELTQKILEEVAQEQGFDYKKEEGEAAFYGPKLDFKIKDSLGREWQCSTLQFDFNLPERFDMVFTNQKGEKERPYVLHRVLFGAFERFIGVLLEQCAGALPLWLAPEQIWVTPIGAKHLKYARQISQKLMAVDCQSALRVKLIDTNETIGKKIREAQQQKIPYVLVVGDKEIQSKTVAVRHREQGDLGAMPLEKFLKRVKMELNNFQ